MKLIFTPIAKEQWSYWEKNDAAVTYLMLMDSLELPTKSFRRKANR